MPEVESSNVAFVNHNSILRILEIGFRNGSVYKYLNVPSEVYEELLNADSKGGYIHKNIQGKYMAMQSAPGIKAVTRNVKAAIKAVNPFSAKKSGKPASAPYGVSKNPNAGIPKSGKVTKVKSIKSKKRG